MERYHPANFGDHKHYDSGDVFNLSRDLARPRNLRTI